MPDTVVNNLASDILDRTIVKTDKEKYSFIDPITILMLISITIGIIRVIQECRKDKLKKLSSEDKTNLVLEEIRKTAKNPGFLNKWKIKRVIKNKLTKEQYRVCGDSIYDSLVELGEKITEEQVSSLLEYNNNV